MNDTIQTTNNNSALFDDCVYILDSYGLIYRAYFAFINRPLVNDKGMNVSAIFGFFRNFFNILKTNHPSYVVAAFDSRTPTFRHEMYAEYKATRDKTPQDLHDQVPIIEEILTALGVPVLRTDGFEADDVIATIVSKCEEEGRCCRILSGDKDLMQLVSETTEQMKPDKTGGWASIGVEQVKEEWGVDPTLMLDLLSLTGDSADNVPGIKGVGEKTAAKLLLEHGSLDGIYEIADTIKGAMGEKIRNGKDMAYFSKSLIALRKDVPVLIDFNTFSTASLDYKATARLLYHYGVPAVAKSYDTVAMSSIAGGNTGVISSSVGVVATSESTNLSNTESLKTIDSNNSTRIFQEEDANRQVVDNKGEYIAIRTKEELQNEITNAIKSKLVGFDTETDNLYAHEAHLAGFSFSYEKGKAFYVPLRVTDMLLAGEMVSEEVALAEINRLFQAEDVTVVMHNAKYDLEVLKAAGLDCIHCGKTGGCMNATLEDTMIAAWLLQPDRTEGSGRGSYSLEKLAETKLGLRGIEYTSIVPKNCTFLDVSIEVATPYAAEDSDLTLQLWHYFRPLLEKANLYELYSNLEMKVLPILAEMEVTGIAIEKQELLSYGVELEAEIKRIEKEIYEIVGHEFNIASPKQLGTVLFEELQLPHGKKTKTGYSTDTSVLEELSSEHAVPYKILEYRGKAKLLSTYVTTLPQMVDKNSRIHTSFIQTGTATGRLSSRDPNLQNIPVRDEAGRRIRLAFAATEGRTLISADYSQIELVILAHLSNDENMCKAFNEGKDVHTATASLIFSCAPEAVTPDMRRTAKTINFGVMYGMSGFRLARDLGIPVSKGTEFITSYFSTYSGIRTFMDSVILKAEETGFVETIMGRKRQISNINSKNKNEKGGAERMAINTPIQGSAADIVKKAMIEVHEALQKEFPTAKLLLQVHDELIAECDEKDTEAVAKLIKETMENVIKLRVPLRASVEYGKRWGEFH